MRFGGAGVGGRRLKLPQGIRCFYFYVVIRLWHDLWLKGVCLEGSDFSFVDLLPQIAPLGTT